MRSGYCDEPKTIVDCVGHCVLWRNFWRSPGDERDEIHVGSVLLARPEYSGGVRYSPLDERRRRMNRYIRPATLLFIGTWLMLMVGGRARFFRDPQSDYKHCKEISILIKPLDPIA